jgi:mono/diheme cytochrome c family protein
MPDGTRRWIMLAVGLAALAGAAGCRQNMHNQARVDPYEESDFFPDGMASRPLPANTVARGWLREDRALYAGIGPDGRAVAAFPMPVTREVLRRGQERYNTFCSPCHDRVGTGRGMIVQRGYTQPSSFHIDRLRTAPVGYFFDVVTRGFGVMPSYATQVPVEDRWAIVAYIRALQLAQNADLAVLTPAERARWEASLRQAETAPSPSSAHPGSAHP